MGELMLMPHVEAQQALTRRELDVRRAGLMTATLFWNVIDNTLFMHLEDREVDVRFTVPNDRGNDAIAHPYSYYANSPTAINEYWDSHE